MNTVRELTNLLDTIGTVYVAAGHVLVDDGATRAIYTEADAQDLLARWQEGLERAEQAANDDRWYEHCQAYSLACSATSALHADQVPADVAAALAEESGLEVEKLTCGW
jgi:hypothetical protein